MSVVENPAINTDQYRRYSYDGNEFVGEFRRVLREYMEDFNVNPQTYPIACDLFSGDGSLAHLLVECRWKPEAITCVDIARTETRLVEGVDWQHWDLGKLALDIYHGESIDTRIEYYRGYFDLICAFQQYVLDDDLLQTLMNYLGKPSAYVLSLNPGHLNSLMVSRHS